ncbi:TRAP transporter small permease subunit [Zobellia amurskyensis]|uniref:TRAP transporter small permease subunit n=1 Tax=Zobellia amurskyensis TaxID=248905 RepID=A0A7X3D1A1_9FLAO|nr:TRAP transporter small permease subunit [Zobellia amurskyensis]MUH35420.1 TRAP transporter small permease subunit [Zobellia amurskyensis]
MLHKTIGRVLKVGVLLSTWGLIATVLLQILCRFTPLDTPSWTEEASRLFFIYAMSFGAGLAMKNEYYVHLDMFFSRFPVRMQQLLVQIIPVVVLVLFIIMAIYSVKFIVLGIPEKSPSMGFNMGVAFFSMFVMSASISYYLWKKIQRNYKNSKS